MLPITKSTTLRIGAKLVPASDPHRWPGLGGVSFYAYFDDAPHYTLPILVWERGQWVTHTGSRDIDV